MTVARRRLAVLFVAAGAIAGTRALAYVLHTSSRWPNGRIVMEMQLGSSSSTLIDGNTAWGTPAENAMADWNQYVSIVELRIVRDSTAPIGENNSRNNVFWSSTIFDDPFGENTLAVTTHWLRGSQRIEADVIFNTKWSWNSYRGTLRRATAGGWLHDIRRVALHEFGHVLSLGHPDEAGQTVTAIMNSRASNQETLADDDIAGVRAAYPSSGTPTTRVVTVTFPPRNDTLAFRQQLETKYRDALGRAGSLTFVDVEGTAVWLQEYLRYRTTRCDHSTANDKVIAQINGMGVQAACSTPTSLEFPTRSDSLAFRQTLEGYYRDTLRRSAGLSSVDAEGEAVWTQEYLRYRVNRCAHADAVTRVFQQIEGRGIAPLC